MYKDASVMIKRDIITAPPHLGAPQLPSSHPHVNFEAAFLIQLEPGRGRQLERIKNWIFRCSGGEVAAMETEEEDGEETQPVR